MNLSAQKFIEKWRNLGNEKSHTHKFWLSLLGDVYGVEHPDSFIEFEERVRLKNVSFIDASIPATKVLIEQKSSDVDLRKPIRQSDGSELTPFEQAKRYDDNLPYSQKNRWIVVCNFREFHIHNLEKPNREPDVVVKLEDLEKDRHVMDFLVDETQTKAYREKKLSIAAGELVGKLYDALLAQYRDPTSPETLRSLNVLCVRLVFCFYAEDADILGKHNCVCAYLAKRKHDMRRALIDLFRILNQKDEDRDRYLDDDLLAFPYVNGGLFEGDVEIPRITPEIATLLTEECSRDFDWSGINPTIFGAVFESTLNPETRRSGGMHYTSTDNIHRVIDPLFFDDLQEELKEIFAIPVEKTRERRLKDFRRRLASLTFFDPACGSGNFLTETYISIRTLENDVLRELLKGQMQMSDVAIQVGIDQFYGIEINDFAVSVARTALWIAESQMLRETEGIINRDLNFLPLRTKAHIVEGNALRLDWETIVPRDRLNYIIGNPPFVGHQMLTTGQTEEMNSLFNGWKNAGRLDYVACWYRKAAEYINFTPIHCALVSTNSITQGEQVATLWKPLFEKYGIKIDFAWQTFKWESEAKDMAAVHCVIVGFSCGDDASSVVQENTINFDDAESVVPVKKKLSFLFDSDGKKTYAKTISPYLIDAPIIFIENRKKPISNVPEMRKGNQPTDGGNLIIEANEIDEFLRLEPLARPYIKNLVGADEFINSKPRYCLWLDGVSPDILRKMPHVLQRIAKVREMRLQSPDAGTRRLADKPMLFRETNNPESFIIVPSVSSERRKYVPLGFLDQNTIPTNLVLIIPDATLYHFGVLTSSVHMAWMRAVCGRLEMRYRYSKDIVYNNFPWPNYGDDASSVVKKCGDDASSVVKKCGDDASSVVKKTAMDSDDAGSVVPVGNRHTSDDARSVVPVGSVVPVNRISQTAQGILDARALYPDSSLADLYDSLAMPDPLRRAHEANDKAVLAAYGFPKNITEPEIVAELMKRYQELTIEK